LTHAPADDLPLADFEVWLTARLAERPVHPRLHEAAAEALHGGGKRFRAVLVMAAARLAGVSAHAAYPLAGAVEMIHAYSLVHDDLPAMDDAALRRGRPTLHRRFGEAMAILAGDALLTDAFAVLASADAPPAALLGVVADLANAGGSLGMVGGQVGDILDLADADDVATVRAIHAGKTGALIRWSLEAPVACWAPHAPWRDALGTFAEHLGVLYQVRDDLLDLDAGAARDKDRGHDAGKSTYARLLGISGARAAAEAELAAALAAAAALPAPHAARFADLARWTAGRMA
jgi:farnesyl diphosphate synthase